MLTAVMMEVLAERRKEMPAASMVEVPIKH